MVNINDFEEGAIPESGLLEAIFEAQHALMGKYIDIEAANGLLQTPDCPVDLDSPRGQARLKDFAWRITEELGEALEAKRIHPDMPEHYDEELVDALHFLAEFTLLVGLTPVDIRVRLLTHYPWKGEGTSDHLEAIYRLASDHVWIPPPNDWKTYSALTWRTAKVVEHLAISCNFLKNKPWKRTHMLTDKERFKDQVARTWLYFAALAIADGLSPQQLYGLYFRKKQVNDFRIRSRY